MGSNSTASPRGKSADIETFNTFTSKVRLVNFLFLVES